MRNAVSTSQCSTHGIVSVQTQRVRRQMLSKGWCFVNTKALAEKIEFTHNGRLLKELPDFDSICVFPPDPQSALQVRLKRYIDELLHSALPDESCKCDYIDCRNDASSDGGSPNSNAWHNAKAINNLHWDGGYVRAIVTLDSPGTEVRHNKHSYFTPLYWCLILTGEQRQSRIGIDATLHRRPSFNKKRKSIVFTYYEEDA